MEEIILLKSGELVLKGLNRRHFETQLMRNARHALREVGKFKVYSAQSIVYVEPQQEVDLDFAIEKLSKVFGVAALCKARVAPKDFEAIEKLTVEYLKEPLEQAKTFGVRAKRSDKDFPMISPEIERKLGAYIFNRFPHLSVDLTNPDLWVEVEIREKDAYIHKQQIPGAGGMPVGTGGRAAVLLSGGIDSPVAAYMMAKRGLELIAVHFESPPYTSERALLKVKTLCEKIAEWAGPIPLYVIPFTQVQEEIKNNTPESLFTLIMRRYMMKVSEYIAIEQNCGALVTGESVGQVASQTLAALSCTEQAVDMLTLRPLIGLDKSEIVEISQRIDTYETSILPYEDCCTVFTPRRPKTNPTLDEILDAEYNLDEAELIESALKGMTWELIGS